MTQQHSTTDVRDSILSHVLPDIPFDGWSMDAIHKAATDLKYDDLTIKAAFPNGLIDVLDAFADKADRDMLSALASTQNEDMRTRDKVATALITRFQTLTADHEAVKASTKFWLNPLRKMRLNTIIWRTADRIWDYAGDTATDYNRYTKRVLLSGIIASATLVWLNDNDPDMQKTKRFIDARIENVMQFGKIVGKLKA